MQLTLAQLNKISPAVVGVRGQLIANAINKVFPMYGMLDRKTLQCLIPNMLHESKEFSTFEENMNYSVDALLTSFSRHRISENQAKAYGRIDGIRWANKQAIANTIYGGSWGSYNLGNVSVTDGWDFRGSGILQATGRKVFTMFTIYINRKLNINRNIYQTALALRDKAELELNMHFVCWFIKEFKKVFYLTQTNRFTDICVVINGGKKGLDRREKYYKRAQQVITA